ncbi:hypothetical protein Rsub_05271 [Raphidocelis subcapitata]|uniref:Uncharacterized protein n=1 Tax=Raphidocelis subcapitata TaxID=307507 RepID=A0A2V0NXX5_9CHLO|nr:hypothetical protein Rsub_05271 [Raphidocelis subcapitata]|eukprot:GBF92189.1 hypothetical protein Rsub_05271 [Raphidocelis subcapitata]
MAMARLAAVGVALLLSVALANAQDVPAPRNTRPVPKNVTVDEKEKPNTMLSSNTTGMGASCVPSSTDFFGPGSGCSDTEACCPSTNTCFDITGGCEAFARRCPPPECGRDLGFKLTECPADVTKVFKKGGVKCSTSADTMCFTNATALALKCSGPSPNAAGPAAAPSMAATAAAGALALALAHLLHP